MRLRALAGLTALFFVVGCGDDTTDTSSTSTGSGGMGGGSSSSTATSMTTTGTSMGNDLGKPCTADRDCQLGFCFTEAMTGFPHGYCSGTCMDDSDCNGGFCLGQGF